MNPEEEKLLILLHQMGIHVRLGVEAGAVIGGDLSKQQFAFVQDNVTQIKKMLIHQYNVLNMQQSMTDHP